MSIPGLIWTLEFKFNPLGSYVCVGGARASGVLPVSIATVSAQCPINVQEEEPLMTLLTLSRG
ncbi:unnamed protein product [Acanthoscelides obtectus]|uniref:Uncharacterized protein n=1 Tax=Acanthoscelides obtectus TaxID=200917 RepID=A0A9P0P0Y1_ACAOB|nr:unnamed protein product [Acanthoscelides obtectus]CAK1628801.1 hypothetical protein AOBTE_LOCUS5409 [Acanthoscelides obtectus]